MKQKRFWAFLPASCLLSMLAYAGVSSNEMKLGSDTAKIGTGIADIPLTLSTTDQVQGLVAAFDWPAAAGVGAGLIPGAALADADTVVTRIEPAFMVLGVVMDSNPNDPGSPEVIGPGTDLAVATAQIRCGTTEGTAPVTFRDGIYATVGLTPVLDNIVVVGGLSIGAQEGLSLVNGSFTCVSVVDRFYIDGMPMNNTGQRCGDARVLMDNKFPVEGYVVALCHVSADLTLTSVVPGAAATAQAFDFQSADVFPTGGTLGVVIDLVAPFTDNTIPAGEGNHIATFNYCCVNIPAPGAPAMATPLTFCDNVLGSPLKENVLVNGGLSISPLLENGVFTCKPIGQVDVCRDGVDNDLDGKIDAEDTDGGECPPPPGQMFACGSRSQDAGGMPGPVEGSIGTAVEVCFFYKSPEDNAPGHAQPDHIQGFSMALTFCCDVMAREVFDISGTIVEAVGAEFVSIQADNDPLDGDGCQLIIGVLVDALPPFDGATLPPTDVLQRVGCVTFDIKDDPALCDPSRPCCAIQFTDGVNGRGKVPIKNLISVENVSVRPQTMDCEICIVGKETFHRGDCNFSNMGMMSVDISDAAAVISFLFLPGTWKFAPPCLDACDCNDDGRIDLADAVCILQYLFQQGRMPPLPGPGFDMNNPTADVPRGIDPTPDKLDCEAGDDCPPIIP